MGLLPQIVKGLVERRVYFKQLLKNIPVDSLEALQCQRRADTNKQILVSLYGTTGSFAYVYPVPSVEETKESFDHDKDYHTSDDSPKTYPKKKIEGPDGGYEPAER